MHTEYFHWQVSLMFFKLQSFKRLYRSAPLYCYYCTKSYGPCYRARDTAQLVDHQVLCSADAGSVPWHSKGVQTLVVFVQPLCVIMSINVCVHIIKLHALAVIPLLGHTKLQHTLGKPLRTECGCSSGKQLENGHVCNLSPKIGVLPV